MSIGSFFEKIGHAIASFFGSHQSAIQAAITDAQVAAGAATAIATSLGEPPSVATTIGLVSTGLSAVSKAVAAEASATTLTQSAANLTDLTTSLVTSGAIGVKNAATVAAIGSTAQKVQTVVGVLETAANALTPPAPVTTTSTTT